MVATVVISIILTTQFVASLWHINDSFIDGRYHYNWGPPFWLMNAKLTNEVGITKSYFGVVQGVNKTSEGIIEKASYYESHPQLIGPIFAFWTKMFGYSEASARIFSVILTIITTALFFFSFNKIFGLTFASVFSILFAFTPIIYIYGKKLDQEALVLLFLSLTFLGYIKLFLKENRAIPLLFVGFLGMMLSDWSGFVFSGLIGIILLIVLYKYRDIKSLKRAIFIIITSVFFALFLFVLQRYFQDGGASLSISSFIQQYFGLWKYRAGIQGGVAIPWSLWLLKQYVNLLLNFSAILLLLALAGLIFCIKSIIQKSTNKEEKSVLLFVVTIFIGQLFYIIFLQQASFVHLYYQYYLSFVFAFGIVWLIKVFSQNRKNANRVFIIMGVIALILSIWQTYYAYTKLLTKDINGDETDIALIKSVKNVPLNIEVIAMGDKNEQEWFSGPNIQYYTDRTISFYQPDHVPFAPYTFVPKRFSQKVVDFMISGKAFGSPLSAKITSCSTNYCLIKVETAR